MAHYANRNPQDLEPHFFNHMLAMTSEGLHDKADIALELAYRDKKIATLQAKNDELVEMLQFIVDDDDGYSIEGIYKLIEKYKQE